MKLIDVMTRDVEVISPDDPVREAAEKMRALNVGVIPVCDGDKIRGMVTDRDIVVRGLAVGKGVETKISEIMTPEVAWLYEDRDVDEAARLMKEKQIRRVLVLNHDKKLVGIVSLGDLATEARNEQLSGDVLEGVSEPSTPNV